MTERFYAIAAKFGHSRETLEKGVAVRSTLTVQDVDQLRDLLDHGHDDTGRENLAKALFEGIPLTGDDDATSMGIIRRVTNFLHGTAPLSELDRSRIQPNFPLEVEAESNPNQTISNVYPLTSTKPVYSMNWGTLTLADGGCLVAYSKAVQITIDQLVRTGSAPTPYADINILGATGATGGTGSSGSRGSTGTGGSNGYCSSVGIAGPGGQNGNTGGTGIVGGTGGTGSAGAPSQQAIITISSFGSTGTISVATRSGTGGVGGTGGQGGPGGAGGKGGDGVSCECTGNGAGNGARGGTGGNGGRGGDGGEAASATTNVVIYVPSANINQIFPLPANVPGGGGGMGGSPGAGGPGGGKGSGGKHNGDGSLGGQGATGATGASGTSSAGQGTPAKIQVQPL